jgi:hypothetical protein
MATRLRDCPTRLTFGVPVTMMRNQEAVHVSVTLTACGGKSH